MVASPSFPSMDNHLADDCKSNAILAGSVNFKTNIKAKFKNESIKAKPSNLPSQIRSMM